MLRKLITYDCKMYRRTVKSALLIYALFLLTGVTFQLVQIPFLSAFALPLSYGATIFLIPCAILLGIVHYYRHLYTNQGYLTHTLPVSPSQRYYSKLISSLLLYVLASLMAIAGFLLLMWAGGNFSSVLDAYYQGGMMITASLGLREWVFWLLIAVAWLWVFFSSFALYSFCITVGMGRKLANFGRLGPVVVYIGIYMASLLLLIPGYFFIPLSLRLIHNGGMAVVAELPTNILNFFGKDLGLSEILEKSGGIFKMGLGILIIQFVITLTEFVIAKRQMNEVNLR